MGGKWRISSIRRMTKLYLRFTRLYRRPAGVRVSMIDRQSVEKELEIHEDQVLDGCTDSGGSGRMRHGAIELCAGRARSGLARPRTTPNGLDGQAVEPDRCPEDADQVHHAGAEGNHASGDAADGAE